MRTEVERFTAMAAAVFLLSGVFAFAVNGNSYALTGGYMCGYTEEHTHTENCYENVLVCGKEEHLPLCGVDEHLHTIDCCTEQKYISCGLQEHTHTEFCFNAAGDIICGMAEHIHNDSCYTVSYELTCGKQEHSHVDSCYPKDENGEPYEIHRHTSACWQRQCTCGKKEHKHDPVLCMFASMEGVENEAVWTLSVPFERLTGSWGTDLLTVAASQIGYTENMNNTVLAEDGKTRLGYTRYGHWYGYPYGDWCAMFAAFCMHYAGIPADAMPVASGVETWIQMLSEKNLFNASSFYSPKPGDLVFITDDGVRANHMGIVQEFIPAENSASAENTMVYGTATGTLRIIQGNKEDAVQLVDISVPSYVVVGYVDMEEVYYRWNNINSLAAACGGDNLELRYADGSVDSVDSVTALRCFTSSEYYAPAMSCASEYLASLGVNASGKVVKLYEAVGLVGDTLFELPEPDETAFISGTSGAPLVAAFSVNGRLIIMICT